MTKTYVAASMQKALKQIREELGDDAIILSNRKLGNGQVEITVQMEQAEPVDQSVAARSERIGEPQGLQIGNERARQLLAAVRSKGQSLQLDVPASAAHSEDEPNANLGVSSSMQASLFALQQEMSQLQSQLQMQRERTPSAPKTSVAADPKKDDSVKTIITDSSESALQTLRRQWRRLALSEQLLTSFTRSRHCNLNLSSQKLYQAALQHLHSSIPRYRHNPIESPGVYAFVGPTGAGKTTTLAKLAARQCARWGAQSVGVVTMDSFRIGAWEQTQRLGQILGVKTALCRQEDDLLDIVSQMRGCRTILIDTAGLSFSDHRRELQWTQLRSLGDEVETFLVTQVNLQSHVLNQLLTNYRQAKIRGVIYTKCDEVISLGEAVSALIQADVPWVFACDGQKIPDDLHSMSVDSVVQTLTRVAKHQQWPHIQHSAEQERILMQALN